MNTQLQLVTLLSFAFACARPQPVEPPAPAPVDRSGPLEIEFGDRILESSAFVPHPSDGCPAAEPNMVGWSSNSGEFMVCVDSTSECQICDFHRVGAEPEQLLFGDVTDQTESGEVNVCDQPSAALEQRLAVGDYRIGDGEWAYGADVALVLAEVREPDERGSVCAVQVGARLRSESASVTWVETVGACGEGWPDVHIDAIAPSPDGQTIAVLVHANAGENADAYPLRLIDARALADAASNR